MIIHTDCRFFKGDIPCKPHKDKGVHCEGCMYYKPFKEKILIIKLGAIGDVIRTTPLLRKLRQVYPEAEISWLTNHPEIITAHVDRIYALDLKDTLTLLATPFDFLYNLDKDKEACSLTSLIQAKVKKGFFLKDGRCSPIDAAAYQKWLTGLFDDISRLNSKSYPEEIFEICGFDYDKEKYVLEMIDVDSFKGLKTKDYLIGLNTGCGNRWNTRIWPEEYWIELAKKLNSNSTNVILLGGPQEDEKNKRIAQASGSLYLGHFPLKRFVSLIGQCDLVVTGVTMALHIALALKRKVVLLNNIFNRNEFELYNLGLIVEPHVDCLGCYKTACEKDCMNLIKPSRIIETCGHLLSKDK
jgi:heptosyltransferase-2